MGSARSRIDHLGDIPFNGQVGKRVSQYALTLQALARDLAVEFDEGAMAAESAMRKLRKHPQLRGVKVYVRAMLVTRRLRRARDLCKGISAEAVKFNLQYQLEFHALNEANGSRRDHDTGGVDL